jgi:TPR repeat protein/S1-C subfamily serine protease
MRVALLASSRVRCKPSMTPYRVAGLFLALVLLSMSPRSATAGFSDGVAAYNRGDYETAFREFMPLALAGGSSAQHNIGTMYAEGQGVPQDYAEAARWFRLAAEQGLARAQCYLGWMYDHGRGISQDDAEAVRWYRLAADQGLAEAQHNLGWMYAYGRGVPQDNAEAVRWYRLAADQGLARAQYNLGTRYAEGRGVSQDYPEAARWFRLAADQGLAEAQDYLGRMYVDGQGVPQDYAEAARWFRLAAAQGHAEAQSKLGFMYVEGSGVPQDDAEALRWIRLSAEQGEPAGQLMLGAMYADGRGLPQDYVLAYMWLNLAAARLGGERREEAVAARDEIAARLSRTERARGQELARNWQPRSTAGSEGASPNAFQAEFDRRARRDREVQQLLADLGYDPGPADGVVGPRTRAAIRAFQADVGLPVDGQISDELHTALTDALSGGESVAARSAPTTLRLHATGTGFAVSENGPLVTNHHVVAGCTEVRVQAPGQATASAVIVARDPENDLALLAAPVTLPAADLRSDPAIRAGDTVVAVGFPLHGLLASEANVTTGAVSALAGIGNDARLLQMTVPVQPGNSGGPLLDLQGRVVGVVVGKLDAVQVASVTGDIPQNVNFAIKADVVRSFVRANRERSLEEKLEELENELERRLEAHGEELRELSPAEVGAQAKEFTVLVECWK